MLLNWKPCFVQGCFFAAEKSKKEKSMQKAKTNTQKNLRKEQKEKKEPAVDATAGSMLKKCFVKA